MDAAATPSLAAIDLTAALADKAEYESRLHAAQRRLLALQQTYFHRQRRAIVVFEGWDAAGKGGAVRRLTEKLDPRGVRVHAIGPPLPSEQGRHYLYRFWRRLPEPGTFAVFDRSWYGRVLVERVDELIPVPAWRRAYDEINAFEQMLVDDGVRVVKIFLHISAAEQLERFRERLENPWKRWKLGPDDLRNRRRHAAYVAAYDEMFSRTSTAGAPWQVIAGEAKWYARVRVLELIADAVGRDVELLEPYDDEQSKRIEAELRALSHGE